MRIAKFLPAAALLVMPFVAPMTAFAADSAAPAAPTSSTNGLAVSGDVVLSGICQVEGQFQAGQMMVFRAQVLESDGSALDPKTTSVTANLANGSQVTMSFHGGNMFVGTYVVPLTTKPGALPYTITAKDASGHTGTFVPLGIPPMIVDSNITIAVNGKPVGTAPEVGASVQLYPIIQFLKSQGIKVGWNGRVLSLTSSALPGTLSDMGGNGPYTIVVNGKTVFRTTGEVMKDPYSHQDTTYLSTDIFAMLVDASNRAATFAGNVLNVTTTPAPGAPASH